MHMKQVPWHTLVFLSRVLGILVLLGILVATGIVYFSETPIASGVDTPAPGGLPPPTCLNETLVRTAGGGIMEIIYETC